MADELADVVSIRPEMILDCLTGKADIGNGCLVVRCEGVDVCKYDGGMLTHVACDHPRHGSHPMFAPAYEKIQKLSARLKGVFPAPDGPCPKCDGTYWLQKDSAAAQQQVLMSQAFGMWRGIRYIAKPLDKSNVGVMIGAFLEATRSGNTSSGPVGKAAPGRAGFSIDAAAAEPEPEQGKGKGETHEK